MAEPTQMWVAHYDEMPSGMRAVRAMESSSEESARTRTRVAIGLATFGFGLGAMLTLSTSNRHFLGLEWANGD